MPDFVPILAAAVLSLIILAILFGGYIFYPEKQTTRVGSRTIDLGENFQVVYTLGQETVATLEGRASRGIFSGQEKKVEFNVDRYSEIEDAIIRLKIGDSNYYGNMIIGLNAKEIYRGAPIGEKTISVDPDLFKKGNFLDVRAESSSWKIWAPTVYDFGLDMFLEYETKKTQRFEFDLTNEEIVNLRRAKVAVFGKRNGVGHLIVSINGNEVFSGYTTVHSDISTTRFKEGTNSIEILTEANTVYDVTSAELILFF